MEHTILLRDKDRVVYQVGDYVHKKRLFGLEYEYQAGLYVNSLKNPRLVETVEYKPGRLTTKCVIGSTWYTYYMKQESYEKLYDVNRKLLLLVKTLPFTHYDLHMSNVMVGDDNEVTLIDLGLASIPHNARADSKYTEGNISSISCGIFPSIPDPDYDKMLLVHSLHRQSERFGKYELMRACQDWMEKAGFNNTSYPGYESFLPLDFVKQYSHMFYRYKLPLLKESSLLVDRSQLASYLHNIRSTQIEENTEETIYNLLYSYKRYRIRERITPSISTILDYL